MRTTRKRFIRASFTVPLFFVSGLKNHTGLDVIFWVTRVREEQIKPTDRSFLRVSSSLELEKNTLFDIT